MTPTSRRAFIGAMAQIPFAVWFSKVASAQLAPQAVVRPNALSAKGQAMLAIYADAVKKMKAAADSDPTSWTFQWYTHAVKGSTTKKKELTRVYQNPNDPNRQLAVSVWDTCQAHHPGSVEDYFLPWHRMYVFYLERIVRKVSGNNDFALPYWNYSSSDPAAHGVLPKEFRQQNDATFGSLYVGKRNPGVNGGQPIDQGQPPDQLSTNALDAQDYETIGVKTGFNQTLDENLHGNVHV